MGLRRNGLEETISANIPILVEMTLCQDQLSQERRSGRFATKTTCGKAVENATKPQPCHPELALVVPDDPQALIAGAISPDRHHGGHAGSPCARS